MNRLCAYLIIGLLFLFFSAISAVSTMRYYYYRCKDELFPPSPQPQYLPTNYDPYPAENDISVLF
jgi:hypothetical protein